MVEEQDTHLLMAEPGVLEDPGKPVWYLANTLETEEPYTLGAVIAKGRSPVRLLAVVHDIDLYPTCTTEYTIKAYQNLLQILHEKDIKSVGLPLLGTVHGKFSLDQAVALLSENFLSKLPRSVERIWLVLPPETDCRDLCLFKKP